MLSEMSQREEDKYLWAHLDVETGNTNQAPREEAAGCQRPRGTAEEGAERWVK